jgi:drug/metabolite transporter (DMT)-like permease
MSRSRAVALMLLVTLMWSIAGVVTKRLDHAASFEVTFWRSAFTVISLAIILSWLRGPATLARLCLQGGWPLAVSSLCWAVMFTAFMVAMTLTSVANVLITLALGPLFTAIVAAVALRHRLPLRTWMAMVVAGLGIVWIVSARSADAASSAEPPSTGLLGMAVALCVPIAGAINWTLLQRLSRPTQPQTTPDMMIAVMGGAALSTLVTLPLAWPFQASLQDVGWLAILGLFQLAIPCAIAVTVARHLSAPEMSLLALLEVVFGVTWAWLGAGETPTASLLMGGTLVIGALVVNEALQMRATATASESPINL